MRGFAVSSVVLAVSCTGITCSSADTDAPLGPFLKVASEIPRSELPTDTLAPSRLFGDSLSWERPYAVGYADPYLIVGDLFSSPHLTLIELASGSIIDRFGRDGEGPNEFRIPLWFTKDFEDPSRVWVYDRQIRRFTLLDLAGSGDARFIRAHQFNPQGPVLTASLTPLGAVSTGPLTNEATLLLTDSVGDNAQWIKVSQPHTAATFPYEPLRRIANATWMALHPSGRFIVVAYFRSPRLDFFDASGVLLGTATGPREIETRLMDTVEGPHWHDDDERAYLDITASEQFVYARFCGCPYENDLSTAMLIHIYRWNGEFVAEVALDRLGYSLAVSPDDRFLYTTVREVPYPAIAEWELPKFR